MYFGLTDELLVRRKLYDHQVLGQRRAPGGTVRTQPAIARGQGHRREI